MPATRPVFNLKIIGIDNAVSNTGIAFDRMLASLLTAVRVTGEKVAKKAATALRRGRYKAYRTGRLSRGHRAKVTKVSVNEISTEITNIETYAGFIHNGTRRMKGRPWLRETVNREQQFFVERLKRALAGKSLSVADSSSRLSFDSRV